MTQMSSSAIKKETQRLYEKLHKLGWGWEDCGFIAPTTLEINRLKKGQDAVILAHSYQTPDIMYGVGDYIGDSYGLSRLATEHPAKKIIFCSVYFMGETAKLLNPEKEVLVPSVAGCSLADSITGEQVQVLRKKYPHAGIVCYVNSYAEVKAASDTCCTSSNVVEVVEAMPQEEIIFIPDKLMGQNLRNMTSKKIITWEVYLYRSRRLQPGDCSRYTQTVSRCKNPGPSGVYSRCSSLGGLRWRYGRHAQICTRI